MPRSTQRSAGGVIQIDRAFSVNPGQPVAPSRVAAQTVQAYNKDVVMMTAEEVTALDAQQLTDILNKDAETLLGKRARSKTTIPFDGATMNNPYAAALTHQVPLNLYVPNNVFHRDAQRNVVFEPWLWRLGTTPAMNAYAKHYNTINGALENGTKAFPIDEWNSQKRRVRNRGYKRRQREREDVALSTPQSTGEGRRTRRRDAAQ